MVGVVSDSFIAVFDPPSGKLFDQWGIWTKFLQDIKLSFIIEISLISQ